MRQLKRASKKQIILECCRERGFTSAGTRELRVLLGDLRRRLPGRGATSLGYIAQVLAGSGVVTQTPGGPAPLEEPYATRLKDALRFHDLQSAEDSLRNLDAAFRDYLAASDRRGVSHVRAIVLTGKQWAARMSVNPRLSETKRREKREIAEWFKVWLQTPGIFFDWIELRKRSPDYQREFGHRSDTQEMGRVT